MRRIERFRDEVGRKPLSETLWRLYEETGYLAYAGGLPNGRQRRANLLKLLYEWARRFGTFRRQGLYRFLRFVEMLAEEKQGVAAAPALGEAENVVTIMEYPPEQGA